MAAHQPGCCCVVDCTICSIERQRWVVDLGSGGLTDGTTGGCCTGCDEFNGEYTLAANAFVVCGWIKGQVDVCQWLVDVCDGCREGSAPNNQSTVRLEIFLEVDEIPATDPVRCGPFTVTIDLQIFLTQGNTTNCISQTLSAVYSEAGPTIFDQDPDDVTTWLTLDKDSDNISGSQGVCDGTLPATIRIRREV